MMQLQNFITEGFLLIGFLAIIGAFNPNITNAETTCYPSEVEFLNEPPASFPSTKPITMENFEQMEADYGVVFPDSKGFGAVIQSFHVFSRKIEENLITSSQSSAPRIIEFRNPVIAFGMFVYNFGNVSVKTDAQFNIAFTDDTEDSCFFPDPDPTHTETKNPKENKWSRFFGVSSDKPIKKIIFSTSEARDGFGIWGLRILERDENSHWFW